MELYVSDVRLLLRELGESDFSSQWRHSGQDDSVTSIR